MRSKTMIFDKLTSFAMLLGGMVFMAIYLYLSLSLGDTTTTDIYEQLSNYWQRKISLYGSMMFLTTGVLAYIAHVINKAIIDSRKS